MRKFQVTGNPGTIADVLGAYGYYDEKSLAEFVAFTNQYMQEKNIAKHFPGVHWQSLEMDLADDFKQELLRKAEVLAKKQSKVDVKDLTWELAKKCAENLEQINQNNIPSIIQDIIKYAKPFANSPSSFLCIAPSSPAETKAYKENLDVVEEKAAQETKDSVPSKSPLNSPEGMMIYHTPPLTTDNVPQEPAASVTTCGNIMAFSCAGSSLSVSSSSTSSSFHTTPQAENNHESVLTPNTLTPGQQRSAQVRHVWATKFPQPVKK